MPPELKPDAIDYRLLELLQIDARASVDALSDSVGLSRPACYRRIQRLRETRLIEREIAVVSPRTMGWPLMMIVLVTLERDRTIIVDQFIRKLQKIPQIVDAWYITGDYDFALRMIARDMEHFDTVTREALSSDCHVKSFKTLVSMRQIKSWSPLKSARSAERGA